MSPRSKIKRNDRCPCQSGKKYKHCCEGRVDWNEIRRSGTDCRDFLSVRGRNLYFADKILESLQLDNLEQSRSLKDYKSAFSARAVREIHEAALEAWPPHTDIVSTLAAAGTDVSGLYIGDYGPEYISRGLVRHSIYANKILVVDPFVYPTSVRDEYNPILNPEQYRNQTLKNANLYFSLVPWIEAGIVEVIRTPADFDPKLNWESLHRQQRKFEENEELKEAAQVSGEELISRHREQQMLQFFLSAPDSYIRKVFEQSDFDKRGVTTDQLFAYINQKRESDPNFLEPLDGQHKSSQLHMVTTGANYEIAKLTATITGSYLVTDLHVKWKEIELDRAQHSAENKAWAPFAKAVQNVRLKYFNELSLEHALLLRRHGRLEGLRTFLHRVWRSACGKDPFDEANAVVLGNELTDEIRKAEAEWKQIDRDLLKIVGGEVVAGLLAAGPLIASGHAGFLAAASVVAGAAPLTWSTMRRRSFMDMFPAALFIGISK